MKLPSKALERKLLMSNYQQIIGIDEVGMGCLAGPVVVCAAMFNRGFYNQNNQKLKGLKESKLLSPLQREKFVKELLKNKYLKFKICYAYPKTIDRLNIYQAKMAAMKRVVSQLVNSKFKNPQTMILVDGNKKIQGLPCDQKAIVKGDQKIFSIACASIIAKVYRDKMMIRYAKRYPGYGFEVHKGYGTKHHYDRLASLGPCNIHRRSFRLV